MYLLLGIFSAACSSAEGPPYGDAPEGVRPPQGLFYFQPRVQFYGEWQRGEVMIQHPFRNESPAFFQISILGRSNQGRLETREYRGSAHLLLSGVVELRSDRCYSWIRPGDEKRITPRSGWDCDHLVFSFVPEQKSWKGIRGERTRESEWFGGVELKPLYLERSPEKVPFHGQVMERLDSGEYLGWGHRADRKCRPGDRLQIFLEGGRRTGTFLVHRVLDNLLFGAIQLEDGSEIPDLKEETLLIQSSSLPPAGGLF